MTRSELEWPLVTHGMPIETAEAIPRYVHGSVQPGFEGVAYAFAQNFAELGDLGAAFAVVRDGRCVVDLWGGLASRQPQREWRADTLQQVFSGTKGLVALCLLILIDRGQLDPDECVSKYWPEFGAQGKERITVAELASHRARLPGIHDAVSPRDVLDPETMARLLAAQPCDADSRASRTYHALTFGWLCGELIRRVDGRSVGRFFAEEVAEPLELDVWIGLPEREEDRVATLYYGRDWDARRPAAGRSSDDLRSRVEANPLLFGPDRIWWNEREFHAAEIPGAGAIASARSMARLYGCLARDGRFNGSQLISGSALAVGRHCLTRHIEALSGEPQVFGLGFALQAETSKLGPPADAFGHGGAGGSMHGAWPSMGVGFSYAMNELRDDLMGDRRAAALLNALWLSLDT